MLELGLNVKYNLLFYFCVSHGSVFVDMFCLIINMLASLLTIFTYSCVLMAIFV